MCRQVLCTLISVALKEAQHREHARQDIADLIADDGDSLHPIDVENIGTYETLVGVKINSETDSDRNDGDDITEEEEIDEEKLGAVGQATSMKAAMKTSRRLDLASPEKCESLAQAPALALVCEYVARQGDLSYCSRQLRVLPGSMHSAARDMMSGALMRKADRLRLIRTECEARNIDPTDRLKWASAYAPRAAPRAVHRPDSEPAALSTMVIAQHAEAAAKRSVYHADRGAQPQPSRHGSSRAHRLLAQSSDDPYIQFVDK